MKYKILVVDDDDLLRLGIKTSLEANGCKVDDVNSGNEAIKKLEKNSYHLMVTDIMMQDGDGFSLLKAIQDKKQDTIVISALSENEKQLEAYKLNVVDYIVKPINYDILLIKVQRHLNSKYPDKEISQVELNDEKDLVIIDTEEIKLTSKEFELFQLLYHFPNDIFSKYDLLNEVWYGNMKMSEKIVEVTILNIRKKLGKHSKLIKTYRGKGYYYEPKKK